MTAADRIQSVERWLLGAEKLILTVLVVGMTLLGFLQIVLRKGFSGGFMWADVFLRHLVLYIAFLGAGIAAAQDKHFGADVGERLFSGRTRIVAQLVLHVFTLVVCAFLTKASFVFIAEEFAASPTLLMLGPLRLPKALYAIILPLGFFLLIVHYVLKALTTFRELRK